MDFVEVMERFVLSPSEETLTPLRAEIMAAANFDPLVHIESEVSPLIASGNYQAAVDAVWRMMPGVFLSPTAHGMLAYSYHQMGDEKAAQRERNLARLALETLTSSGAGTEEDPYRVLRVGDEYDVLRGAQRTSVAQRAMIHDGQGFDVHECADGSEVWFQLLWQTS
ncbi:MAG: DUF4919 domain-containing protein [Propionibacteriaceae bacterium]|nr:DUF4919 domain-containing protein [Propionibacteriaceae bacterium]